MYILFDECVARSLAVTAEALGHTVQRSVDVVSLGRGASDRDIFDFACRSEATVVTVNRGDFIRLASKSRRHFGVIIIPSMPSATLRPRFKTVLVATARLVAESENLFIEIDAAGLITSFRLP